MGFLHLGLFRESIQLRILVVGTKKSSDVEDPSHTWSLALVLSERAADGNYYKKDASAKVITFKEPRSDTTNALISHDDLRKYLNGILDSGAQNEPRKLFKTHRAQDSLYATELLNRTGLVRLLTGYLSARRFPSLSIAIDVRSTRSRDHSSAPSTDPSFHTIQWEILEDLGCWKSLDVPFHIRDITVRRRVWPQGGSLRRLSTDPKAVVDTINILLVIARETSESAADRSWNPSNVLRGLLTQQRRLQLERGARHRIHLEVVRPGTLEELGKHLERFKEINGKQFDAVHFDMHGDIIKKLDEHRAVLLFNSWEDNKLSVQPEDTQRIADLLVRYEVPNAMLGSCKSATADFDLAANLAQSLAERGVQNVLAMSFNMADTMAFDLFKSFYDALLWKKMNLSASARVARRALRANPIRYSSFRDKNVPVNDWFVPVVYSNGKDFTLNTHNTIPVPFLEHFRPAWLFGSWLLAGNQWWARTVLLGIGVFVLAVFTTWLHCYGNSGVFIHALDPSIDFTHCRSSSPWCERDLSAVSRSALDKAVSFALLGAFIDCCYWFRQRWHFSRLLTQVENDKHNLLRIEAALRRNRRIFVHGRRDNEYLQAIQFMRSLSCFWRRTNAVDDFEIVNCAWFKPSFASRFGRLWHRFYHFICFVEDTLVCRSFNRHLPDYQCVPDEIDDKTPDLTQRRSITLICNLHLLWPENPTIADVKAQENLGTWIEQLWQDDSSWKNNYVVILGHRVGIGKGDATWFERRVARRFQLLNGTLQEPYNLDSQPHHFGDDPRRSRRSSEDWAQGQDT